MEAGDSNISIGLPLCSATKFHSLDHHDCSIRQGCVGGMVLSRDRGLKGD
jgi:hypothetical protein